MDKFIYEVSDRPHVTLEVHGELKLRGDDDDHVLVKPDSPDDLKVEQNGSEINIRCLSNCVVRVPPSTTLEISQSYGDVTIKGIEGAISLGTIHGNLSVRNLGTVKIQNVYGNLEARSIEGDLEAERIDSNATIRNVEGHLKISFVGGNLTIDEVTGGVEASANGNLIMRCEPEGDQRYALKAGGNLTWMISEDASAQVEIRKAAKISANLPGMSGAPRAPYSFTMGEGEARIELEANGNVNLNPEEPQFDFDFHFENFDEVGAANAAADSADAIADQVTRQIEAQMEMLERQLENHLSHLTDHISMSGLTQEQAERVQQRAREASERAAQRAQEKMRLAQERLERKMAAVQQRVEQRARQAEQRARQAEQRAQNRERRGWSFGFNMPESSRPPMPPIPPIPPMPSRPPMPPVPPSAPRAPSTPEVENLVSDDERLVVLRMLKEKKISLEQAEKLLAALEGKDI